MSLPELDVDKLRRLYDYGGLLVYRVNYFDPVRFQVLTCYTTFNEDVAKIELERLLKSGRTAGIESFMVKFDGAFAKGDQNDKGRT